MSDTILKIKFIMVSYTAYTSELKLISCVDYEPSHEVSTSGVLLMLKCSWIQGSLDLRSSHFQLVLGDDILRVVYDPKI